MTDQTDVAERLLAAIEKVERTARTVAEDAGPIWSADEQGIYATRPGGEQYGLIQPLWSPLRDYLASHDPDTEIGRCAAHREIVALYVQARTTHLADERAWDFESEQDRLGTGVLEEVVRILARMYRVDVVESEG